MRQTRPAFSLLAALALLAALVFLAAPGAAQIAALGPLPRPAPAAAADPEAEADLFAMPAIADETRRALALIEAGDLGGAGAVLDALIARHPRLGQLRVDRAAVAMLAGAPEAARAALEAAAGAGYPDLAEALADPIFAPLAGAPDLAARAAKPAPQAPRPVPAPITGARRRSPPPTPPGTP